MVNVADAVDFVANDGNDYRIGFDNNHWSVSNLTPIVTMPANQAVVVGTASAINLGAFTLSGDSQGPWKVVVNWEDSSTPTQFTLIRSAV